MLDEAAKYNIKLTPILLNLWIDDGVPLVSVWLSEKRGVS